ncbi:receptor-type tyrosine-protein phosphatase kappa [Pimephales promelas]|nr:receptor-type tyrosine-protein phosphatase kappa [Pimephales promelas]
MDTIIFSMVVLHTAFGGAGAQYTPGGCSFDDGPAQCDYQQDPYDDFDWTHVSAQEVPYLPSDLPQGSYMMVDTSQHDYGEKARLQLPVMKENDTHCIDFNYLLFCPDGSSSGTLNILVKVNKGPLANPIWNITSCTGRDWMKAELAVSTFWPNEYQKASVSRATVLPDFFFGALDTVSVQRPGCRHQVVGSVLTLQTQISSGSLYAVVRYLNK